MMPYEWTEVSAGVTLTKEPTFSKWVWFWQVGWHKVRGWRVLDRTWLRVRIERDLSLEEYILSAESPIMRLISADIPVGGVMHVGGINKQSNPMWRSGYAQPPKP